MPRGKKKAKIAKDPNPKSSVETKIDQLADVLTRGFDSFDKRLTKLEETSKMNSDGSITITQDELADGSNTTLTGTTPTDTTPEEIYVDPAYKEAAKQILGNDFELLAEIPEDQVMYSVVVPDKYRNKSTIKSYLSHWKSRRTLYENELTRRDPNISSKALAEKMEEYDRNNPNPIIPEDKRSIAKSVIKTIVDIRKWLMLVRQNIKLELAQSKGQDILPTESLQEELDQ